MQYPQKIKLVIDDQGTHKISMRVADWCVDMYIIDDEWVEKLRTSWQSTNGVQWTANGIDWFVQNKHVGMPSEYVRISAWPHAVGGLGRDYRVGRQDLLDLFAAPTENE